MANRPGSWSRFSDLGVHYGSRPQGLVHLGHRLKPDIFRRSSDHDLVGARLDHPIVLCDRPVGEGAWIEGYSDNLCRSRLQIHLLEPLELARWLIPFFDGWETYVHLHHFRATHLAGILHLKRHRHSLVAGQRDSAGLGVAERRIREPISKREQRLDPVGLKPAISHINAFAVMHLFAVAGVLLRTSRKSLLRRGA